jgi:hypothetical protein
MFPFTQETPTGACKYPEVAGPLSPMPVAVVVVVPVVMVVPGTTPGPAMVDATYCWPVTQGAHTNARAMTVATKRNLSISSLYDGKAALEA